MPQSRCSFFASAAFGLEGLVSSELKRLGMADVRPENGGAFFEGTPEDAFLCNLRLRFSDRVYMVLGNRECLSFEDLFQLISAIPWESYTAGTEAFNISAQCARSRLMSPRDCQAVTKKALIERLKQKTGRRIFPESGAPFPVHIAIHEDRTRVLLDLSGTSLSRRGYRTWNGEAPLRETLAASLVEMSPWRPGLPLYDPCCGTGTLLIEAALRQGHLAPGRNRSFALEELAFFRRQEGERIRQRVMAEACPEKISGIAGSDIDPAALELALRHERQAGIAGKIDWKVLPLQQVERAEENGVFLCNPPYGERLSDQKHARELYRDLGLLQRRHPTWTLCAISSDPGFEKAFGRTADRRRRLYNGRLECQFYTFLPRKGKPQGSGSTVRSEREKGVSA